MRALRIILAIGATVLTAGGLYTGNRDLVMLGLPLLGWALPWLREIVLDREMRQAIAEIDAGETRTANKRMKRVTGSPPTKDVL